MDEGKVFEVDDSGIIGEVSESGLSEFVPSDWQMVAIGESVVGNVPGYGQTTLVRIR